MKIKSENQLPHRLKKDQARVGELSPRQKDKTIEQLQNQQLLYKLSLIGRIQTIINNFICGKIRVTYYFRLIEFIGLTNWHCKYIVTIQLGNHIMHSIFYIFFLLYILSSTSIQFIITTSHLVLTCFLFCYVNTSQHKCEIFFSMRNYGQQQ